MNYPKPNTLPTDDEIKENIISHLSKDFNLESDKEHLEWVKENIYPELIEHYLPHIVNVRDHAAKLLSERDIRIEELENIIKSNNNFIT